MPTNDYDKLRQLLSQKKNNNNNFYHAFFYSDYSYLNDGDDLFDMGKRKKTREKMATNDCDMKCQRMNE